MRPLRGVRVHGAQRLVPVDHVADRRLQRGDVERAGQPDRERDVVGGRGRVELVEEPHPLLRQRQRDAGGTLARGSEGRPRRRSSGGVDARRRVRATVGASNSSRTADCGVRAPRPAARHDLGGDQRVAAELEEVVVGTDPLDVRAPRRTCPATISSTGVAGRGTRPAPTNSGSGQRLAVELADRGQRDLVEDHHRRRHHVRRQASRRRPPVSDPDRRSRRRPAARTTPASRQPGRVLVTRRSPRTRRPAAR